MLFETELAEIKVRVQAIGNHQWQSFVEGRDHECGSSFIMAFDGNQRLDDIEILGVTVEEQDFIAYTKQDIVKLLDETERLKQNIH